MSLRIERDVTGAGRVEPLIGGAAPSSPDPEPEPSLPSAQDALAKMLAPHMLAFLRAGGAFSWNEWKSLDEVEREVATWAGEFVTEERIRAHAALVGLAARSAAGIAEVLQDPECRQEVAESEVIRGASRLHGLGGF